MNFLRSSDFFLSFTTSIRRQVQDSWYLWIGICPYFSAWPTCPRFLNKVFLHYGCFHTSCFVAVIIRHVLNSRLLVCQFDREKIFVLVHPVTPLNYYRNRSTCVRNIFMCTVITRTYMTYKKTSMCTARIFCRKTEVHLQPDIYKH